MRSTTPTPEFSSTVSSYQFVLPELFEEAGVGHEDDTILGSSFDGITGNDEVMLYQALFFQGPQSLQMFVGDRPGGFYLHGNFLPED